MAQNTSAKIRLNIETYFAGGNQPTHPSVIAFEKPWNGYKYWMAYTPFPKSNGEEENPSIAVSNDLLYWDIPKGFLNPIAFNEEIGCHDLKDPHILYRDDLDRIEVWYLGRIHPNLGGDGKTLMIFRKCSVDGIHWSDYEIIAESRYLSPSVIWDEGKYKFWGIGYSGAGNRGNMIYRESPDAQQWSEEILCTIDNNESGWKAWHGSVSRFKDQYWFVYMDDDYCSKEISFACSPDGVNYTACEEKINLSKEWFSFYRPFLFFTDNRFYCFYGLIDRDENRYISYNSGKDLSHLDPINESDVSAMKPLEDCVPDTHSISFYIRVLFRTANTMSRWELFLIVIPFIIIVYFFDTIPIRICILFIGIIVSLIYLYKSSGRKPYERLYYGICCMLNGVVMYSIVNLVLSLIKL